MLSGLFRFKPRSFDVINTHFAVPSGPVGYVLSKALHVPNVLSIHGGDLFDPSRSLSPHKTPIISNLVSSMLRTAHRVIAQSNDTKGNAYKYYDIKRPIEVIPLGIKRPVFKNKCRSDFDLKEDEIVFCTIGRLVKRKNIGDIFRILSRLKNDYEFKLLIIGDGPERNNLEKRALQKGLIDNIRFLGSVSDEIKFQVLNISDYYLSTALHEGFGLVFLEAMACSLPIVCYDRGGQKDFLVSGKTGFLVEFGNKMDFRHRIVELINHSKLRSNISEYNRSLMNKYYISTCAERYISLFSDVISEHSRAWLRMN
jgi:glycosyltransferase involved in cell wall biosynthesis